MVNSCIDMVCGHVLLLFRAADVIKQHPNTMVMLDHCGLPYIRDESTMNLWKRGKEVNLLVMK